MSLFPRSPFLRFSLIGLLGFVVDGAVLSLATDGFGMNPLLGRVASILVAVTVTWVFHRNFTFQTGGSPRLGEWTRFLVVNGVGAATNYLIYAGLLFAVAGMHPLQALAVASVCALAINYVGARQFAFRKH